jgi:glycosyltransferase involved in cell wall biosynthesis
MRILQVIPYFFLSWAGGGTVPLINNLAKSLSGCGHQLTIYTTDAANKGRKAEYPTETDLQGVRVCEFKSLSGKLGQRYSFHVSPAMVPMMAKETANFDVIHLHEYRTFQNIVAHHYARKFGVPYVVQAHGSLPRIVSKMRLKQIYDNFWGDRLLKDASKVIAVTGIEAEQYKKMGVSEDKIAVIPHGIDLSEFDNLPEKGEFRKRYGLSSDQRVILYLGRIHEIKGLDLLAGAFADLSRDLNDVKLVVVGRDDGYLASLKKLIAELGIEDKVIITGPLSGREKLGAYVDGDIYVLPSYYEIFSVTVLEACACGTPVIVTDRCGLADVVKDQVGLVVPCDKDQLRNALTHMLSDDKMRLQFGEKGKSLVREKFNWERMAEGVERVYKDILRGAGE